MKTPNEIKKGLECCNSTHYDACHDCPYKGECDAVFSCIRRKSEDTTAYIQQLEASYSQVSKALCGKENATLEEVLQAVSQVKAELAAIKRERDAAMFDLQLLHCCEACMNYDRRNVTCMSHSPYDPRTIYCPFGWQWRGVCPENTEIQDGNQ